MNTNLLASKPRFEILDGLRGVAAIIVVMFHLFETYSAGPCSQILNHGYLAVDFFFMLSGFVIGYAYDDRWGKGMTQWNFYKRRLIRLQPMVIMGSLIGAFWFFFGDAPVFSLVMETPWWKVLLITVLGCLMFPTPPSMDIRGWQEINSLNGAYCAVAIMLLFPMIVSAGAGSPLEGQKTIKVCKFLGAISYPLYITHYPMIYVQMKWAAEHADAPLGTHIWVAVWIFIASIAVAYACLKVYDEPVREWLKSHWLYKARPANKA